MSSLQLLALVREGMSRAVALRERQHALQDDLDESKFPELPYDNPPWDDDDRWELGPAVALDAVLVPSLDDDDLAAYWPDHLEAYPQWRILISPDHSTLLRTRAHDRAPVVWAMPEPACPRRADPMMSYRPKTRAGHFSTRATA
jgi:hypothetical protein